MKILQPISNLISKKTVKRVAIFSIIFFLLIMFIAHVLLPNRFSELKLLIHKYTDLNIRQNTGLHQYALIIIRKVTFFLPEITKATIVRDPFQLGTKDNFTQELPVDYSPDEIYFVASEDELLKTLRIAKAGSLITIDPGEYHIIEKYIKLGNAGEVYKPIILRAAKYGTVTLTLGTQQGFYVDKPFWVFENLIIKGECSFDGWCDHAFHLAGDADYTIIRNNYVMNFNAHIKGNGLAVKGNNTKRVYPDHVKIINNSFVNDWKRNTINSVTPIDVVGGDYWLVKNNFIADFGKYGRQGHGVTYGAFLKGGGQNGVMEENLVACEWKVPHTSTTDIRIGLSLGGGGSGQKFCVDGECKYEHTHGIIRNNIILNCLNDVGVYINKGFDSKIYGNHIYGSLGIDVRFEESSAEIYDNPMDGRVKARDGATLIKSD